MIVPVTTQELRYQAWLVAQRTREELAAAGVAPGDWQGIAHSYGLTLCWTPLPMPSPGCYLKAEHTILLNPRGHSRERLHFTFYHELMHHQIEHDEALLSLFADAVPPADETTMECLCDAGAAELLMPWDEVQALVQAQGLSPRLIPQLCQRYRASSIQGCCKVSLDSKEYAIEPLQFWQRRSVEPLRHCSSPSDESNRSPSC